MLLLAHLSREPVPPVLRKDLDFLLTKGMPLLAEMLGMAAMPRMRVGARLELLELQGAAAGRALAPLGTDAAWLRTSWAQA